MSSSPAWVLLVWGLSPGSASPGFEPCVAYGRRWVSRGRSGWRGRRAHFQRLRPCPEVLPSA
eukprot:scaffold74510_cov24-Phaeocystis_antarctica.AAC.1